MRLIEEILADINKAKAKVTSVELEIGHTTGVSSQINRLIQAQNLLTYCHSRLSDIDHESLRPKWISVEDRLPEKSGRYLAVCYNGHIENLQYSAKHKAFNAYDEFIYAEHSIHCTHWMPLPELPNANMRGEGK